jgi:hypothetical protein
MVTGTALLKREFKFGRTVFEIAAERYNTSVIIPAKSTSYMFAISCNYELFTVAPEANVSVIIFGYH